MRRLLGYILIAIVKLQNSYLRWRLRRSGIDPDSLPEIKELRRRFEAGEPLRSDELEQDIDRDQTH
jgi:hypothetical protein